MKQVTTVCFFVFAFSLNLNAQIDDNNNAISIPAVESEEKGDTNKDDDTLSVAVKIPVVGEQKEAKTALSYKKYTDTFKLDKPKSKGFTMLADNDLVDPGVIYEEKWSKKERESKTAYQGDQYLGDFKNNGKFVNVIYRDHEYPDGDRIRVFVNDDVAQPNVLLTSGYKGFKLNLKKGFNKIDFVALNQGESGPNTAELLVYDDNEVLVSSNKWNLSTGAKATIIIVKE